MNDDPQSPQRDPTPTGLSAFWAELKRRKVMRVAITYIIASIAIIEFASATFGYFDIPKWAFQLMTLCLVCGFPIAVIIAWAFELTPDGIKTTKTADKERDDTPVSGKQQRKRNWFAVIFAAAVPTVIFGTLALFFYVRSGSDGGGDNEIGEKSIAVLPLENMSPDPNNAFFADGVHEDIIGNLSKIGELLVIGRTSTLGYRDTTKKLRDIGIELGVRYLLEGSVRRAGNEVRVRVTLVDSNTEAQLWSEDYERTLTDTFAIQAEIAQGIAEKLKMKLTPDEIENIEYRPTENQEAYDNFVKYRQMVEALEGDWDTWISLLDKAVTLDPNFLEAWALLAVEGTVQWADGKYRSDPELFDRVNLALEKAEALSPDSAYVLYAKGWFASRREQNLDKSISLFLEASTKDPSFYRAQSMGGDFYAFQGKMVEAQHHLESSYRVNPIHTWANRKLLMTYELRHMWDKARDFIQINLNRGIDEESWQRRLVELDYLQNGGKVKLSEALSLLPSFKDSPNGKFILGLLSQDYPHALLALEDAEIDQHSRITLLARSYNTLHFRSKDLVSALILFKLEEEDKCISAARSAAVFLKEIVDTDPISAPTYRSNLAISYALLGERELMEEAIQRVREQTNHSYWIYGFQVHCELHIAIAHLVLGDHDKAIETLEAASKMDGPIFLNRELDLWFIFDRLRGNPRFEALLEDN